ncbi:TIGR03085 family metal-binding protein [Cellulomonas sp. HZM]|uniref:TIGR03085 family metal-binding protein n=1 Tax=Cellulomonas sp. HZM TaxID=1454010 RepID=UPI000492F52F|nr:TIGR03085 family metal-binding protein [Cellulomonas sp. HZM]
MTWHETLRAQLADALRDTTPDAPTLCEGWEARHLAAHVVLRETSASFGAGLVVPGLAGVADAKVDRLAATATDETSYLELVDRVAAGPARWNPMHWAGDAANVVEFYVHAEDVRRGAGPVPPRELDPDLAEALWKQATRAAGLALRKVPAGVVLVRGDGVRARVHGPHKGHGTAVVRGDVGEIVLYLLGRGAATDVTIEGAPDDVDALTALLPTR